MLNPIPDQPDLFRDTDTGQILHTRDFTPLDRVYPFDRWTTKEDLSLPYSTRILQRWSILMHPWPEVISPNLLVRFEINDCTVAHIPLFEAARPLARPETVAIEKRIRALEEACYVEPARQATEFPGIGRLIRHQTHVGVRVEGPADDFMMLREMTKVFSLRLEGLERAPIR